MIQLASMPVVVCAARLISCTHDAIELCSWYTVTNHTSNEKRSNWPRHAAWRSAVRSRETTSRVCAFRSCSRGVLGRPSFPSLLTIANEDVVADDATMLFLPRLCLRLSSSAIFGKIDVAGRDQDRVVLLMII